MPPLVMMLNERAPAQLPRMVLALTTLAILWACGPLIGSLPFRSDDFFAHVAVVDLVRSGNLMGWDRLWFGGWPLFQFYSLGFHLAAAALSGLLLSSDDPARLSVALLFATSLALLPWAHYRLAMVTIERPSYRLSLIAALLCSGFTLWFLLGPHDRLNPSLVHQFEVGQVAEPAGWLFLLMFITELLAMGRVRGSEWKAALALALLLSIHLHTTLLAAAFGVLMGLFRPRLWRSLLASAALAAGLSAYFWLPYFANAADYTHATSIASDIHLPLEMLLALGGVLPMRPIDVLIVVVVALGAGILALRMLRRDFRLLPPLAAWLILAVIVGTPAASDWVPAGLHFQRFNAPLMLMLTALASAVLASAVHGKRSLYPGLVTILVIGMVLAVYPLRETRATLAALVRTDSRETEVVHALEHLSPGVRVLAERITPSYTEGDFQRGKLLISLLHRAGIESVNGLFIQGAPFHSLLGAAAGRLGMAFFAERTGYPAEDLDPLDDLRFWLDRYRISHLVQAIDRPPPMGFERGQSFGRASLLRRNAAIDLLPRRLDGPVVGVLDLTDSHAFLLIDAWLMVDPTMAGSSLLELPVTGPVPPGLAGLICIADNAEDCQSVANRGELIHIPTNLARRPWRSFNGNPLAHQYPILSAFLDQQDAGFLQAPASTSSRQAQLEWNHDGQSVTVSGLEPKKFWQIPYNYFPYWHSDAGALYRGSAGFMVLVPVAETHTLSYRRLRSRAVQMGWVISVLSVKILVLAVLRRLPGSVRIRPYLGDNSTAS